MSDAPDVTAPEADEAATEPSALDAFASELADKVGAISIAPSASMSRLRTNTAPDSLPCPVCINLTHRSNRSMTPPGTGRLTIRPDRDFILTGLVNAPATAGRGTSPKSRWARPMWRPRSTVAWSSSRPSGSSSPTTSSSSPCATSSISSSLTSPCSWTSRSRPSTPGCGRRRPACAAISNSHRPIRCPDERPRARPRTRGHRCAPDAGDRATGPSRAGPQRAYRDTTAAVLATAHPSRGV